MGETRGSTRSFHSPADDVKIKRDLAEVILEESPVGFALLDRECRYLVVNDALATMYGVSVDAHMGRTIAEALGPAIASLIQPSASKVLASGSAETAIEISLTNRAGIAVSLLSTYFPVASPEFSGVGIVVHDITDRTKVESEFRRSENRYRSLVSAAAQIVWTSDAEGLVREDSQSWRRVTGQTVQEFLGGGWINAVHPDDRESIQAAWSAAVAEVTPFEAEYRLRTAAGEYLYMLVRGAPVWEDDEVTGWVGLNIDINALRVAERQRDELVVQAERNERLQQVAQSLSGLLAPALSVEEVVGVCVERVPELLDVPGLLILYHGDGLTPGRIWATPTMPPELGAKWRLAPRDADFPAAHVARTGQPLSISRSGVGTVDSVPLSFDDHLLGALTVVRGELATTDGESDTYVRQIADVVSQALGRARRFQREHSIAADLQRSMLPRALPEVEGIDLGAAYRAGSTEADVGGDWFELLPLDDGSALLAVGDVMGKGLPAAHTMIEFRQALRSLSILSTSPAQLLDLLSHFHQSRASDPNQLVTLVIARLDPAKREFTWASAGHLPPLVQRAGGEANYLESSGLPLGIGDEWDEQCVKLTTGDIVTLFSDGLVEGRSCPLDVGLERLKSQLAQMTAEGAAAICDKLIEELAPSHAREDDATVLVVRFQGQGAVGRWSLPRTPHSVRSARGLATDELGRLGIDDPQFVEEVQLLVSELVTNAVLHGAGSLELDVARIDRLIRVSVIDESPELDLGPRPMNVAASTGRGLLLVDAMSSAWGVEALPVGKRVWFEMQVPDEDAEQPRPTGSGG